MCKYIILQSIVVCLLLIAGCNSNNLANNNSLSNSPNGIGDVLVHDNYTKEVSYNSIPAEMQGEGKGLGFVRPEDKNTNQLDRPQTEEFRLEENDAFTPDLILVNGTSNTSTFLISTILDYQQVTFKLDGKEGLLHEVKIPPKTEMEFPFDVIVTGAGSHDLQVLGFDDPYNLTLDKDYRMNLYGHIASRRTVIVIGDDETPIQHLDATILGTEIPKDIGFLAPLYFASINKSQSLYPSERQLYVGIASPGHQYPLQIILNNTENISAKYAMISFLNYHQIKINDQKLEIADLKPKQQSIINTEISLPEKPGIQLFQIIWLFDPYRSVLRNEVLAPYVFGSPRIAIDTR